MPKAILFDADGVVLKKQVEYFSVRFAREYGAPLDEVTAFFKNEYRLCQQNKLDLKEELAKRLPAWGWDKGVNTFLDYWFSVDVTPDEEVLAVVQEFREKGIACYLASDQEKYRKEYLLKLLEGKLDGFWFSCDLGYSKSEPEFFKEVLSRLNLTAADVTYWDDDQKNVEVARLVGIDASFYTSLEDLKNNI